MEYARRHGVILLPTWKFSRILKDKFGINADFRRITRMLLRVDEESWDRELKKVLRVHH